MYFYSAAENSFYRDGIHSDIPSDAKEITDDDYRALMNRTIDTFIAPNEHGMPTLIVIEPNQDSVLDKAKSEQAERIAVSTRNIDIIKPAVDGGYATPESELALQQWQRYRYELTLVPEQPGWPASPQWPAEPESII